MEIERGAKRHGSCVIGLLFSPWAPLISSPLNVAEYDDHNQGIGNRTFFSERRLPHD